MTMTMRTMTWIALVVAVLLSSSRTGFSQIPMPPSPKPISPLASFSGLGAIPKDLAITPDQKVAFVVCDPPTPAVCNTDLILAFDLTTGNRLALSSCASGCSSGWQGGLQYAADAVQVTNTRAVVIRSVATVPPSENILYVDIFAIDTSIPSVTPIQCYSYNQSGGGVAHDLAITPDGTKAVVAHGQSVKVFDLVAASAPLIGSFCPFGGPGWALTYKHTTPSCETVQVGDIAADSVEVTNTRAFIQYSVGNTCLGTGCAGQQQYFIAHPQIYVIALDSLAGACNTSAVFRCGYNVLDCGGACECHPDSACASDMIHDLAITPNGERAVSASYYSLGLVSLPGSPSAVWSQQQQGAGGLYRRLSYTFGPGPLGVLLPLGSVVDSIATSNTRAIALQDHDAIRVFDISSVVSGLVEVATDPAIPGGEDLHDVAISPDGLRGIVNCIGARYIFTDLSTVPTPVVRYVSPGTNPRGTESAPGVPIEFVSDSVLITNQYAVAISRDMIVQQGVIHFFSATTGALYRTINIPLDSADDRLVDLTLSLDKDFLFVRAANAGKDLYGFVLQTGLPVGRSYDLDGECAGVDSIEATNSRLITISNVSSGPTAGGRVDIYSF